MSLNLEEENFEISFYTNKKLTLSSQDISCTLGRRVEDSILEKSEFGNSFEVASPLVANEENFEYLSK